MVERANRPSALSATPGLAPQPQVTFSDDNSSVRAVLPTGESVTVLLHGATITSWTDASGSEKLWLSSSAHLDGSKPVRGGIPLVFPVFGTAPDHAQTASLAQHGFARSSRWEFLGKSTSESASGDGAADLSAKLDFGLSAAGLSEEAKGKWSFAFNLIYSVTLNRGSLTTSLVVTNDDEKAWDCQVLLHTYLRVKDINEVEVHGLDGAQYVDKVDGAKTKSQSGAVKITGETDRVYTPVANGPVTVAEGGKKTFTVTRDNLSNVVVWNPWTDKAAGMGDFSPKDGFKNMLCIEPGSVSGWQSLEPGDAYEGAQTITYHS
ncbi:aldose 1-epimerase [Immersiella caudata]|uniref:Glucose-6-phosphate 1-epimerase n=1 Tax=Immersiella caudata TaxID=314043 RepID=A0AA39XDS0_9PEZI|nr:aldose 1-epimerase [Immersiella caudata]